MTDHDPEGNTWYFYYGDKLPHETIEGIKFAITRMQHILVDEPTIFNCAFDMMTLPQWPGLAGPLAFDILRLDVPNDLRLRQPQHEYTKNERYRLDDPLSHVSFMRSCEIHLHRTLERRGCICLPGGAMRRRVTAHTIESYLSDPHSVEFAEQICILDWTNPHERDIFKKTECWSIEVLPWSSGGQWPSQHRKVKYAERGRYVARKSRVSRSLRNLSLRSIFRCLKQVDCRYS